MPDLPTPANVPAGHVVRIVCGSRSYTSVIMAPNEARTRAAAIEKTVAGIGSSTELIHFDTAEGTTARIRARAITVIESGPPHPRKETPRAQTVNVFLDSRELNVAELIETDDDTPPAGGR